MPAPAPRGRASGRGQVEEALGVSAPIVAAAAALVDGYAGWDPSLIDNRDDDNKDSDGFDVDDYVPSSDECSDGEGEDKGMTAKDDGGDGADAKPSIDAADDEAGLTALNPRRR